MTKDMKHRFDYIPATSGAFVIVDKETGVEYYKNGVHMIALVDADGKPKINKDWYDSH
ncbi:DUF6440 family protein [Streptococcus thoraltensis]|uniref:DUF6440 family protein n=1 Tax=Streptococcus thoraltensis TaxID=55085 RepID=UPI00037B17BB|nr:DUF6440 family protein [Streptococcus thoraltensis]MDY4761457.1 DUF6440 family protein [Streptococcus thoraltensis]